MSTSWLSWHQLLHRRLLVRLAMPVLVGVVMLGFVVSDVFGGQMPPLNLLWAVPGLLVGYPFGRLTKVAWDHETAQVVAGGGRQIVVLVAFVGIRFAARFLLNEEFGNLSYVTDLVLLITVGALAGRSLGLLQQIRTVLISREP